MELLKVTFGNYFYKTDDTLFDRKQRKNEGDLTTLCNMMHARMIYIKNIQSIKDIGIMKELTGGDTLYCRDLYDNPFKFKPNWFRKSMIFQP